MLNLKKIFLKKDKSYGNTHYSIKKLFNRKDRYHNIIVTKKMLCILMVIINKRK